MRQDADLRKGKEGETRCWFEKRQRRWDKGLIWEKTKKIRQGVDLKEGVEGMRSSWFEKR